MILAHGRTLEADDIFGRAARTVLIEPGTKAEEDDRRDHPRFDAGTATYAETAHCRRHGRWPLAILCRERIVVLTAEGTMVPGPLGDKLAQGSAPPRD